MSEYCGHCGQPRERAKGKRAGLFCFSSLCLDKPSITPRTNEVALNSEFNDGRAIYMRRPTIQFQIDPVVTEIVGKRTTYNYKAQSSILKAIKVCRFVFNVLVTVFFL